jgi:hypothetical protein
VEAERALLLIVCISVVTQSPEGLGLSASHVATTWLRAHDRAAEGATVRKKLFLALTAATATATAAAAPEDAAAASADGYVHGAGLDHCPDGIAESGSAAIWFEVNTGPLVGERRLQCRLTDGVGHRAGLVFVGFDGNGRGDWFHRLGGAQLMA